MTYNAPGGLRAGTGINAPRTIVSGPSTPAVKRSGGVGTALVGKKNPITGAPIYDFMDPGGSQTRQQEYEAEQRTNTTLNSGREAFENAARSNANYSTSFTDPRTGQSMSYRPAGGGGAGAGGGAASGTGAFDALMAKYGGTGDRGTMPRVAPPTLAPSPRLALDTGAIDRGSDAAFSRAKDQVGQSQQGLQKALTNSFASRGLRGSSMEGRAIGSALESGAGELADVSREEAIAGSGRAERTAETQFTGDISQRGQDASLEQSRYGGEISQRGQDLDERDAVAREKSSKIASVLGLWNAFNNGQRY